MQIPGDFEAQIRIVNEQMSIDQPQMEQETEDKNKEQEEELTEEQKERRRKILEVQLANKRLLYSIHNKDMEIFRVKKEIEDQKQLLADLQQQELEYQQQSNDNCEKYALNKSNSTSNEQLSASNKELQILNDSYLSHRALVSYDTYLRGTLREQDRKIYELELNNADISEISARIEKINKEYERNIQPLVVGDFKTQIDADIKSSKNQIDALRNQFKEIVDDIVKLHEKHLDNIDMYSTLQRQLQEQLLANEQLDYELSQLKKSKEQC
ncbi:unnamed protein product (macronuclear) [Paramecium tetraurelia]|uniref:Uncharacterized protein n=1 Tax=Paramecium tetraurelia TaxID=5888 RepID=A0BRQ7_PARTE|nr:uncharacterized protein GSPATT00031455001 [Paramecium tetraurelia]CAK61224.1 unnamed protein product [Paramecium tetraurelia]|eukprot:XP_001428622.1 hypothetical protein (macronuclear) [Paramecium tetraurelia strain d4-2]